MITLSNSTALFGALKSGEVDVLLSASIDEDQRNALHGMAKQGELREGIGPAMGIGYVTLLSNAQPLLRKELRRALALSLDREEISERVSYGLRQPLRSLVPPSLPRGSTIGPVTTRKQLKPYCAARDTDGRPPRCRSPSVPTSRQTSCWH